MEDHLYVYDNQVRFDGETVGVFSHHWAAVAAMIRVNQPDFRSLGGDMPGDLAEERRMQSRIRGDVEPVRPGWKRAAKGQSRGQISHRDRVHPARGDRPCEGSPRTVRLALITEFMREIQIMAKAGDICVRCKRNEVEVIRDCGEDGDYVSSQCGHCNDRDVERANERREWNYYHSER